LLLKHDPEGTGGAFEAVRTVVSSEAEYLGKLNEITGARGAEHSKLRGDLDELLRDLDGLWKENFAVLNQANEVLRKMPGNAAQAPKGSATTAAPAPTTDTGSTQKTAVATTGDNKQVNLGTAGGSVATGQTKELQASATATVPTLPENTDLSRELAKPFQAAVQGTADTIAAAAKPVQLNAMDDSTATRRMQELQVNATAIGEKAGALRRKFRKHRTRFSAVRRQLTPTSLELRIERMVW
jgi:hypothetical protein